MFEQVAYPRVVQFLGRNGYGKQKGAELFAMDTDRTVQIAPVTSKDTIGRCNLEIPFEALDDFIKSLQKIQATIK
jgi:predicted site-specific integrase-resolvase